MNRLIITLQIVLVALLCSCKDKNNSFLSLYDHALIEENNSIETKALTKEDLSELIALPTSKSNSHNALEQLRNYDNITDTTAYLKAHKHFFNLAAQNKDISTQIELKEILSTFYYRDGQLDSAFANLVRKEHLTLQTTDSLEIGKTVFSKAKILFETGIYTESERECLYAIRLISKYDEPFAYIQALHLLALNLTELNQYTEAETLYLKCIDLVQANTSNDAQYKSYLISNIDNNLSHLYYHIHNYNASKEYALKGINNNIDPKKHKSLYSNLLLNYIQAKIALEQYDDIEQKFEETLAIERKLKTRGLYVGGLANTLIVQAKYYHAINKDSLAIESAKESYKIATSTNRKQEIKNALAFLASYDIENQHLYLPKLIEISDHITLQERLTKNKFARLEYQAEKLTQTNTKLSEYNKLIVIISSLLIFVLIITTYSIAQAAKNKRLSLQQRHQGAKEEIYKLTLAQKQYADNATYLERKRIAKELHDGIINRIFTTRFHLMQLNCNSQDQRELLVEELHKAEQEIRTISTLLNKPQDTEMDSFDKLLKDLIDKQANAFHTVFTKHIDPKINWSSISSEQKLNIYRIIQEALQNINTHSQATFVNIDIIRQSSKAIAFKISDNGIGFDKINYKPPFKGMGVKNMKYRAKELQSVLKINSSIGQGVEISFTINTK